MRIDELDYDLPPERIAQQPAEPRDSSRLLRLSRSDGTRSHHGFAELPDLLPQNCLLVMNDTKVVPARLHMHRGSGGRIEGLYLQESRRGGWEVMVTGAGKLRPDEMLTVDGTPYCVRLIERVDVGVWRVQPEPAGETLSILAEIGHPPLPPYIHRAANAVPSEQERFDLDRYQTIYARQSGAIAAPTAGLHFTPAVLEALSNRGAEIVYVTLHVGAGTFLPIRCENLADHPMHEERYECSATTANAVNQARQQGRTVVAIGTTSVRVLETCATPDGRVNAGAGRTRLFIYPPYSFRVVDAMLTNFHLPGSTLLAMVFAFAGRESVLAAYQEAISRQYRFYSYGDAMLIV